MKGCRCEGGCEKEPNTPGSLCWECQRAGCRPVGPRRWRDKLFWRLDEDREWRHILEGEWNGDGNHSTIWSRYRDTTNDTELSWSLLWTNWHFGPSYETGHEWEFVRELGRRVPTRRTFIGFSLGPLHLTLMVHRPRKGFDP